MAEVAASAASSSSQLQAEQATCGAAPSQLQAVDTLYLSNNTGGSPRDIATDASSSTAPAALTAKATQSRPKDIATAAYCSAGRTGKLITSTARFISQ